MFKKILLIYVKLIIRVMDLLRIFISPVLEGVIPTKISSISFERIYRKFRKGMIMRYPSEGLSWYPLEAAPSVTEKTYLHVKKT